MASSGEVAELQSTDPQPSLSTDKRLAMVACKVLVVSSKMIMNHHLRQCRVAKCQGMRFLEK